MKVLLVNYEYPPLGGGGGVAMKALVATLGELQELRVLTSRAPGTPRLEMEGSTPVHRARVLGRRKRAVASMTSMFSFLPAGLWRGWRLVNQERPDLINTWFAIPSGPTGVLLSKMFKIPHMLTMIGGDVYDPSKWYSPHRNPVTRAVVRWTMASSRWCTTWSTDVRDRAKDLFGREIAIDVVPMGIARPEFRDLGRAALGMDRDAFYCITIGRLIRRKRLDLMLEQFALSSDPNIRLIVIGEGPEEKRLREQIQALGLDKRVELLGAIWGERKFRYLANSDCYVSVASHEGFGLVFLEAMACGVPVLAPAFGGQRDFLVHGKTGLVLEPDGSDLMKRILELMDNPEMVLEMRGFNRQHAQMYFMDNVADIWADTYQKYYKSLF